MSRREQEIRLNNNICTLKGFSEKQVNVQIGVSMSNQYTRRSTQPASNPSRRIMPTTPTPSSHRRVKFAPSVDSNDSKTQRAVRDSIKDERNRQRNVAAANEARTRAIHNENEVKRATFATPTPRRSHAIVSGSQKSHTNPGKSDRQKAYDEARYREQKRMSEARTKDWQRKQKKVDEELSRKQRASKPVPLPAPQGKVPQGQVPQMNRMAFHPFLGWVPMKKSRKSA